MATLAEKLTELRELRVPDKVAWDLQAAGLGHVLEAIEVARRQMILCLGLEILMDDCLRAVRRARRRGDLIRANERRLRRCRRYSSG